MPLVERLAAFFIDILLVMNKPDLTISQVEEPAGRWCSSGHIPPETFKVDGVESPTRFFNVSGNGVEGVFCAVCLTAANYISQQQKKANK
jgi:hypothetical protein